MIGLSSLHIQFLMVLQTTLSWFEKQPENCATQLILSRDLGSILKYGSEKNSNFFKQENNVVIVLLYKCYINNDNFFHKMKFN